MRKIKKNMVYLILFSLISAGCSREVIKPQVAVQYPSKPATPEPQTISQTDSSAIYEELISEELKKAEEYYALGVEANQKGEWEEAQSNFENALDILANLDLEEDNHSKNIDKYNRLLKEIASDYKITLLSLGTLDSEGSISAFLEKFDNIQDFQKLKDSLKVVVVETPDSVTYDMPIEWNDRVENAILYLQTVGRERFTIYLQRSGKYIDLIKSILKEKNLPLDLAYLPLIESGYSNRARSWANAHGMWQFIPSTGRLYGLKSNWWYDEKRDFIKSTYAACDYLSKLYNEFGSWPLALAAYNCGEGGLNRAIKKYRTNNFWELNLRRQTYDYVPLFMAATIIAKEPEKYGFEVEYENPLQFDTVVVDKPVDLKTVAELLTVSLEEIREINPELLRDVTPPKYTSYPLRIPQGTKETFNQKYSELPAKTLYTMHKVRKGETVSGIAKKYGVSPFSIIQSNSLSKRYRIYPGQYLKIPGYGGSNVNQRNLSLEDELSASDNSNKLRVSKSSSKGEYLTYRVKPGDTLGKIAQEFKTSISTLRKINDLNRRGLIRSGETLKVPSKGKSGEFMTFLIYTVKMGESLWGIANYFKVPLQKLLEWNNLSDPSYIRAGDKIKIYKSR